MENHKMEESYDIDNQINGKNTYTSPIVPLKNSEPLEIGCDGELPCQYIQKQNCADYQNYVPKRFYTPTPYQRPKENRR